MPAAVCAILTLAMMSDRLVLIVGIVPLAMACGLRVALKVAAPGWYEAWLAVAAVAAGVAGTLLPRLIGAGGGYQQAAAPSGTVGAGRLGHAAWVVLHGALGLFGGDVLGARHGLDFAFSVLRLTGVIMVVLAFALAAARFFRPVELLVPAFVLAIAFNLTAYLISGYAQGLGTSREIAPVMPLGAVLAGRMLAGPVLRMRVPLGRQRRMMRGRRESRGPREPTRLWPVLAVIGAGYVAALGYGAAQAPAAPDNQPLAAWLAGHGLRDGLAGYWQANSTTLDSGGRIAVSSVVVTGGRLARGTWEVSEPGYDPHRHDAAFVVTAGGPRAVPGIGAAADRTFGPPQRVYHADGYTVEVWDTNLLRRLGL